MKVMNLSNVEHAGRAGCAKKQLSFGRTDNRYRTSTHKSPNGAEASNGLKAEVATLKALRISVA
jgi:hypothetical protein